MLANYFDKIYIINLVERSDRRLEMNEQLGKIGLTLNHASIHLFPAVRPSDAGEFPNIGARGCFLSHLGILNDAANNNFSRILVIEDDLNFSNDFYARINSAIALAKVLSWDILYLGHKLKHNTSEKQSTLDRIDPNQWITSTHFIAFQGASIKNMIEYLNRMLMRKAGDALGGPMHVDGAYSWYRRQNPEANTYICMPMLGYQRASRTDIHELGWLDSTPLVKKIVANLRKIKNFIQ